ncbi:MAG: dUTP diphosphatase [Fimbriimonadaceae bacterium]|nr:dUTP diphosphatase [Fimbriimonadaceae bacterium]
MALKIAVTLEEGAVLPSYATQGSAGMDLRSIEDVELAPLERKLVRTGIRMAIPAGFEGQVRPRSGLALKHGLTMVNTPGTIDSDYRGEIGIILINLGQSLVKLTSGERLAQLVICPVQQVELEAVATLDETDRGGKGFGSTGTT